MDVLTKSSNHLGSLLPAILSTTHMPSHFHLPQIEVSLSKGKNQFQGFMKQLIKPRCSFFGKSLLCLCLARRRLLMVFTPSILALSMGFQTEAVDLSISNVEVTQATQTPGNTIQLVASRSTAVRATIVVA